MGSAADVRFDSMGAATARRQPPGVSRPEHAVRDESRLAKAFAFNPMLAWTQPWTFITYMLLHAGIPHLAINMLMLFVFGSSVEEHMGGRMFILFYLLCGIGGCGGIVPADSGREGPRGARRVGGGARRRRRVRVVLARSSGVRVFRFQIRFRPSGWSHSWSDSIS